MNILFELYVNSKNKYDFFLFHEIIILKNILINRIDFLHVNEEICSSIDCLFYYSFELNSLIFRDKTKANMIIDRSSHMETCLSNSYYITHKPFFI